MKYQEQDAKFQAYRMASSGQITWDDARIMIAILHEEALAAFMLPQLN